jgi:hypothetical protein
MLIDDSLAMDTGTDSKPAVGAWGVRQGWRRTRQTLLAIYAADRHACKRLVRRYAGRRQN